MMEWLVILVAYVSGSIPFAYLIAKEKTGIDVRTVGSGNVGTTNVFRVAGGMPAMTVLVLDIAKGSFPITLGYLLDVPPGVLAASAFAAVVGHVFPLFLGLRGGKGVATAAGAFCPLAPAAALGSVIAFALTLIWRRYVSLASVVAVACFPLGVLAGGALGWCGPDWIGVLISAVATASLVVARHKSNLQRLASGLESRLGERLEIESR